PEVILENVWNYSRRALPDRDGVVVTPSAPRLAASSSARIVSRSSSASSPTQAQPAYPHCVQRPESRSPRTDLLVPQARHSSSATDDGEYERIKDRCPCSLRQNGGGSRQTQRHRLFPR